MYKIFLFFCIISVIISGCNSTKKVDTAVIYGSIENSSEKFVVLRNNENIDTIVLENGKRFHKTVQLNSLAYYFLRHGEEIISVYIQPGDSINILGKADNFIESVKFSGSSVVENNYLIEKKKMEMNSSFSLTEFIQSEESVFIKKADSFYQAGLNNFEKIMQQNKYENAEFAKIEKAKLFYTWAESMVMYETAYNSSSDKERKSLNKNIQKYMSQVNFNDSAMVDFFEYRAFFESYLNMKAALVTKNFEAEADMDFFTNKINVLLQTITDPKVKSRLLYEYFKDHIRVFGISGINELYAKFQKECNSKKYTDEIGKMFNRWKVLEPGNMAPDFSLTDLDGKVHSLAEFKGKMVYIDVWATWCAPCRREIPFIQKLFYEYKGKDIVFISISIDESREAWKKMVEYEKPDWLQLLMVRGKSSLLDDYFIYTIPRFILIDKNGKIINAQAPAASGEIRKLFDPILATS